MSELKPENEKPKLDKRLDFLYNKKSHSLRYEEIREKLLLNNPSILVNAKLDDSRVQPSSFEPAISNEVYVIDAENGMFRPNNEQTVYEILMDMPEKKRKRFTINEKSGFYIGPGFSFLFPLDTRVILSENEFIKANPKSSSGREFLYPRVLADFNSGFDEVRYVSEKPLQIWMLVQPLAFGVQVYPGTTLNQLRFFSGTGSKLSPDEIQQVCEVEPVLYKRDNLNKIAPSKHIVTDDGLQMHLDMTGTYSKGLIALRALHNAIEPITWNDESSRKFSPEEYFEFIHRKNSKQTFIKKSENYLMATSEILVIPTYLSAELNPFTHKAMNAVLHRAGFIDNKFNGDLVLEITPHEDLLLSDIGEMPIGNIDLYWTGGTPDRVYQGNYQNQVGVTPSKHFKWPV